MQADEFACLEGRFGEPVVVREAQCAAHDIAVAAHVLGCRVQHDIGAEHDRSLQHRRSEGAIDQQSGACRMGQSGQPGEVDHSQQRVGRGFGPDQIRGLAQSARRSVEIDQVAGLDDQLPALGIALHLDAQTGVQIVLDHDPRASRQAMQQGRGSADSGAEEQRTGSTIQRSQRRFKATLDRVVAALIEQAIRAQTIGGMLVGGGEMQRW